MVQKVYGSVFNFSDQPLLYSVRDAGVKGDGVTDDTSAIQALLTAVAAAGGGTIFFPAGTYLVSGGLSVGSNTTIRGSGYSSVIRIATGANFSNNVLKLESISNSEVLNLRLDGNRSGIGGGTQYGIYAGGSSNCRVQGCYAHSFSGVGIHSYNSSGCKFIGNTSWDNFFHGMELEQTTNSTAVGNILRNNLRHGLYVFEGEVGATGSKGLAITSNVMYSNTQSGCIIQGPLCDGINFSGNVCRANTESGLIVFDQVKRVSVVGNQFLENGHYGVYLYRSKGNTVYGNTFKNNSQVANGGYQEVLLQGDVTQYSLNNIVSGNNFTIDAANKAQYAIKEGSTSDGPNLITGNMIPNSGTAGRVGVLHETGTQNSVFMCKSNYGRIDYNRGVATFDGDGVTTAFNIPHGLTPDEPRYVNATPASADTRTASASGFSVVKGATNITVTFGAAPILSTGGVVINWEAST